jgi:hypothetical protein
MKYYDTTFSLNQRGARNKLKFQAYLNTSFQFNCYTELEHIECTLNKKMLDVCEQCITEQYLKIYSNILKFRMHNTVLISLSM